MVEEVKYRQIQNYLLTISFTSQKISIHASHIHTKKKYRCEFIREELPQRIVFYYKFEESFFEALLQDDLFIEQENLYLIYRSDKLDRTLSKQLKIPLSIVQTQQIEEIKSKPTIFDLDQTIHDYCYIDIQSTGVRKNIGSRFKITTIVLFDGKEIRHYVNNRRDFQKFKQDMKKYKAAITFYGDIFDLPQIERQLGLNQNGIINFNLKKICLELGFKGSLKKLKQVDLRIAHPVLKDIDYLMACSLWKMDCQHNFQALKVLLAYNAENAISMRYMVEWARQFIKINNNMSIYSGVQKTNLQKLNKIQHQNERILEEFMKKIKVNISQIKRQIEFDKKLNNKWRMVDFIREIAYFDIETTGFRHLVGKDFKITSIVLFDGKSVRTYINGVNLEQFKQDIKQFKAVVTFNGTRFDLPETSQQLGIDWSGIINYDLMTIYREFGIWDGLKKIKQNLGILNPVLRDVNGLNAPVLWSKYLNGDSFALKMLQAYNAEDVIPMRYMLQYACQLIRQQNGMQLNSTEVQQANMRKLAQIKQADKIVMEDFLKQINLDLNEVRQLIEKQQVSSKNVQ